MGLKNRNDGDPPLDLLLSEAYADHNFRCRLILEVVIMVLRGVTVPTVRTCRVYVPHQTGPLLVPAMFLQGRAPPSVRSPGSRMTHRRLMRFHGRD